MRHAPQCIDAQGRSKPLRRHTKPRKSKGAMTAPLQYLAVDTVERDGPRRHTLT
ncbi:MULTISPECIES: hypothetical protein [Methylococcus]|uniref:Uncharacterized protein n=1 Tax=Methylococcus capsulatus TaxID=414 RepID=A0ABZ2F380_METCP|nr:MULTISPECIES: hypothetical protein [Methylococcus]